MEKKITTLLLNILFLSIYTEGVIAQSLFRATAIGGVNLSQVDGDLQQGYRKKDISVGLSCAAIIRPDFDVSLELFYNPQGAKPASEGSNQTSKLFADMSLHYADVIGLFNFHSIPLKSRSFYRQTIKLGFSYGRLLKSDINIRYNGRIPLEEYDKELLKNLKKEQISLVVGAAWQITPRWGFMIRHTSSFKKIYEKSKFIFSASVPSSEKEFRYLKPYYLSIHTFYHFLSPHKTLGVKSNSRIGNGDPLEEL
jgi:hypothetical protein